MLENTEGVKKKDNPESTLGAQDTGRWGNQVWTNWQHWVHKTQDDGAIKYGQTDNIGYTRHRTMGQSSTDKLATLGTQDTGLVKLLLSRTLDFLMLFVALTSRLVLNTLHSL